MAGEDPEVRPPTEPSVSGSAENPPAAAMDALTDEDRAGAGMEIGRMLSTIDEQEKADPFPSAEDVPTDVPPDVRSYLIGQRYEGQQDRSDRRFGHRMYLLIVLVMLGAAAIAGALLFNRLTGEEAATPAAPVAAARAGPAPASQPTPTLVDAQDSSTSVAAAAGTAEPVTLRLRTKWGPYAPIRLLGDNGEGTIRIAKIPSARGTWTWEGTDLVVRFTGKVPLSNGRLVQTGAKVTCTGLPTAATLRCHIRTEAFGTTKTTHMRQWVTLKAVGRLT